MAIDQRGFKTFIQMEAETFLKPSQVMYNSTVTDIKYSKQGVTVVLSSGKELSADNALVTFSVGVLQGDDVKFHPSLPDWKQEAIQSMVMVCHTLVCVYCPPITRFQATYTKIFLQFEDDFWFATQVSDLSYIHDKVN